MVNSSLMPGDELSNEKLCDVFGCSPQGGMRRSLRTNTLVLISNHVSSIYHDRWIDGVLHYTGMGQQGDQRIEASQNKTLNESNANGVAVHLFEVHVDGVYTYVGRVRLASQPYQERQADAGGQQRNVWVFPLAVVDGHVPLVPEAVFSRQEAQTARQVRRLTDEEVRQRAGLARPQPGQRPTSTTRFERDPHVAEYAKRRAKGVCELCNVAAPFCNGNGEPYLETHHIEWLSSGGPDTVANTIALCPNCHRKMHILNLPEDRHFLQAKASRDINGRIN
jgi:5-methylcytosine-specific restriction protein A